MVAQREGEEEASQHVQHAFPEKLIGQGGLARANPQIDRRHHRKQDERQSEIPEATIVFGPHVDEGKQATGREEEGADYLE